MVIKKGFRASLIVCGWLLLSLTCAAGPQEPYRELLGLRDNPDFVYEQLEVPPDLRPLFIPLSLAKDAGASSADWAGRVTKLLHGMRIAPSVHFVSRSYAPITYKDVESMAVRLQIDAPLVFLVGKNNTVKTVQAIKLGGGYHGLLLNRAFVARRTASECRVLVAHELARIARRQCNKGSLADKIWYGVAISAVVCKLAYNTGRAFRDGKVQGMVDYLKTDGAQLLKDSTLTIAGGAVFLVATKVAANFFGAYLSRRYQHEADLAALNAFGDDPEEYLETLQTVEYDEALRRQRTQYQYKNHYTYISDQIDALGEILHPYIVCFLKNELSTHQVSELQRPAALGKASLLNLESSLDDRIMYIYENAAQRRKRLTKP